MAKVELMAVTDELTGVPNRRHFMEVGQREIERARRYGLPLAVAIMDLDHFKNVNDRWGHEAGDAVLAQAARVCAKGLRSTDLFARYGGEEFVMLLYDSPASHSTLSVERLRKSLENMVVAWERDGSSQGIRVTGSFGLTWREPMGDDDLATLLREADDAMYRAKETGRNRLVAFDAASMRLEDREDREDPGLPGGT
jgi:diguanylate cyclase (GGDEF)-like protein